MGNTNLLTSNVNRSFLLGWVFANIVGLPALLLPYGIGLAVGMSLAIVSDGTVVGLIWYIFIFSILALSGALIGAWLGWMQSLSLKAQSVQSGKWIGASLLGVAISAPLGWLADIWFLESDIYFPFRYVYVMYGVLFGLTVGIAQWSVLRQQVHRAGWWMIALPVCFTLGVLFTNFYLLNMQELSLFAMFSPLTALVAVGCITGILLRWLFQFPKAQREGQ